MKMKKSTDGYVMTDIGDDYTKHVRVVASGAVADEEDGESDYRRDGGAPPPIAPRGPSKPHRSPSEKHAFVAMMAAAEERIAVARRENQARKAKIEKAKKGGDPRGGKKKKKKDWAKGQKPGFNLVPAHIRSGPTFGQLRARQGKHAPKAPGHRPARPQSTDYRELGEFQKEAFGF